ncbi:MAG: pantoate--beta-alanine ligase [Gemmatimonadota bacterium]
MSLPLRLPTGLAVETTIAGCRAVRAAARASGQRIALVPTMGALHAGHAALIDRARALADWTVVSVFVNPTQFGPGEDLAGYPRDLEGDGALAAAHGADLLFAPSAREMYPSPPLTRVTMRGVTDRFEGEARPGHFDGVLTVVAKLLHIVQPDVAVFGQKDAQQAAAVRLLLGALDFPVVLEVAPTVREADGLACSSRNAYLTAAERPQAAGLYRALARAAELAASGEVDPAELVQAMRSTLAASPALEVEYAAVVNGVTFEPLTALDPGALAIVAARIGRTRLIDNLPLTPHGG